jgi:hypothetical protein
MTAVAASAVTNLDLEFAGWVIGRIVGGISVRSVGPPARPGAALVRRGQTCRAG